MVVKKDETASDEELLKIKVNRLTGKALISLSKLIVVAFFIASYYVFFKFQSRRIFH